MEFKKLAGILETLEQTDSRNSMTEILSQLIKAAHIDEVDKLVYLVLGQLRPEFDSLQFNLAGKQVQKGLARTYDVSLEKVNDLYKQKGDLGLVAQALADTRPGQTLSVSQVYEALTEIARTDGQGSQDLKLEKLDELLDKVDAESAKYVIRMVLGKLRLGFSDKTIIDALSVMEKGDKSARKMLEQAFQVRPDIGVLAQDVKKKGAEKTVHEISVTLGIPIVPMLCQRLKSPKDMIKKMKEVAIEPKFDGTRVQIHFQRHPKKQDKWIVRTFTRNLEENSWMFPELLDIPEFVTANELVLDSEAVGVHPESGEILSFQVTITRKRKHDIDTQVSQVPLRFYVFDCMYCDGESLIGKPYLERRKKLAQVFKKNKLFVVDEFVTTTDPEVITHDHQAQLDKGLEGVIVKKLDSVYVPGRVGWNWVKMKEVETATGKLSDTLDCVVMGYSLGEGKRTQFGIGKFLVGILDGESIKTVAKIGTGLTDEQFRELKTRLDKLVSREKPKQYEVDKSLIPDVWVDPELVVEVAADEITKSPVHTAGVALRFPRLVKFRDDKGVSEATTLEEVKQIAS